MIGNGQIKESMVVCQSSQGLELHGTLLKLTRFLVVFEIYNPELVLRASEVLKDFRILFRDRPVYSGQAVVRNQLDAGSGMICEVTLNEESWTDLQFTPEMIANGKLREQFAGFIQEWQKLYRVLPEYKVIIADMQSFLSDLRVSLDQVELGIRSTPSGDRAQLERKVIDELAGPIVRSIDSFIDRFEEIAAGLEDDLQPVHRLYLRRQLHPLVLCSPFAYRTFHKPLGYAGDYEVVDMMMRPPYEGSTLFAKIINVWLLDQAPATAHRNRVTYLTRKLVEETTRLRTHGHPARVFNLGCGPAAEVQRFLREEHISDQANLTLLDFNEETLSHVRTTLEDIKRRYGRNTPVQLARKSVHHLLKDSGRSVTRTPADQYDFVYCAGLFDYLSQKVCKRLMNIFYDLLAPGGLLLVSNVSDALNSSRPFRYSMEYILDWHLIYRDRQQVAALKPDQALDGSAVVVSENTGVNVFLEVRKSNHA